MYTAFESIVMSTFSSLSDKQEDKQTQEDRGDQMKTKTGMTTFHMENSNARRHLRSTAEHRAIEKYIP